MPINVQLITYTPDPERVIATAAKLCYSKSNIDDLMEKQTDEKVISFLDHLSNIGHQSPIEHVTFTFGIEGVSRALLAQITRHRIASFSVQSQRYVDMNNADFVVPDSIQACPEAFKKFLECMDYCNDAYEDIRNELIDFHAKNFMEVECLDETSAKKKVEKMANEDARFVLPNACTTKMVITMNARSLMNFFKLRCCRRAQWEIREVANQMLALCKQVAPHLFAHAGPGCVCEGHCTEGSMCCGHTSEVQAYFEAMTRDPSAITVTGE